MGPAAALDCAGHEDDLALLVSDDLPAQDAHRLQQHLAHCAGCRTRLDEYRADAAWLRAQRNATPDVAAGDQLRARIADQIADTPPASWTVAWLHRLFEGATRRGPQPLLAGLAATLLLVGAIGALTRPLGRPGAIGAMDSADLLQPSHRHVDRDLDPADEVAFDSDGDDGAEISAEDGTQEAQPSEELAASTPGAMRIEMKTSDPDVRIIWFAQADHSHGTVKP